MDYTAGINGMNFNPISNYNSYLKDSASFDVGPGSFEKVLSQQTQSLQNPMKIQGGVEMSNFESVIQNAVLSGSTESSPSGHFLDSFGNSISGGLSKVNASVDAAHKAQESLAMGEDVSVHDVMIAAEKASLSMQMTMQLRNKLINAYNEINNIRV